MEKFTCAELLAFLSSDKNELEYFGYDKQDLISLYEYLSELKERNDLFQKMIFSPLESIKSKNRWVKNIVPARDINADGLIVYGIFSSIIKLKTDDYDYICTEEGCLNPFWHTKLKYKSKLLGNSQVELHEINSIVNELSIDVEKLSTISGNFTISVLAFNKCYIDMGPLTLFKINIPDQKIIVNERFVKKGLFHIREGILANQLDQEQAEKLVKKLYLKK